MGSGACVPACPEHVLTVLEGQAVAVNMSACIGHGACVTACPVGAIELVFGSEKRGIDIPRTGPDFQSNVPGVFIAGELGGMGLIANAIDQGAAALANAAKGLTSMGGDIADIVIVGAGPAGIGAAAAAKTKGLKYILLDQEEIGGAVRHYPRKKLVFTRPVDIPGYGKVNLKTLRKEELVTLFTDVVAKVGLQVDTHERVDKVAARPGGGFIVTTVKRDDPDPAGDPRPRSPGYAAQARRGRRRPGEGRLLAARARALPVRPPDDRRRRGLGRRGRAGPRRAAREQGVPVVSRRQDQPSEGEEHPPPPRRGPNEAGSS